ncbi:MAG: hypothetical protein AAGE65_02850 [Planctomycetota bacterium]
MTRPVADLRLRSEPPAPAALANEPFVSEPFGDFPLSDPVWPALDAPFTQPGQPDQPAHQDPRGFFFALDDDDDMEDDDLFDDDENDDELLDDDDDDDDFFDDDEDDFDDDDDDDDDDSYFLGDDD